MSDKDLQRIAAFRLTFARRQAAEVTGIHGGVVVLHPEFAASHEHNQLILESVPDPAALPALAEAGLGHLPHRRITVLDGAAGEACVPVLTAAGYNHETELLMTHSGPVTEPAVPAREVTLAEMRSALIRQWRVWMPTADDTVIHQLADRRTARLRGAERVSFLAVRDEAGTVAAWADLYAEPSQGVAQIEEVVTAEAHTRRGYGDTVLATALHRAAGLDLVFLLADPNDWPRTWYARRGFTPVAHTHVFTRSAAKS